MEFVIVGAGAVGCVVGTLLEADGHRVRYLARPSPRTQASEIRVDKVGGSSVRSASPRYLDAGDSMDGADWILVCVRGEQLDAAFRDVIERMGGACPVAVAAVSLDSVVERGRSAGLTGTVLAYHVSFGSFRDPRDPQRFVWSPFALPSTITPEGERGLLARARELGRVLHHTGLATRSLLSMRLVMLVLVALNSVLALGWALSGWDLERLVRDAQLRTQTAAALRETLKLLAARSAWLRWMSALLPLGMYTLTLRALARFMGPSGREVWRHHGPKISQQTDYVVRDLLARGVAQSFPLLELRRLFARWQAADTNAQGSALRAG
jgi:ketopantoate reductase